MPTNRHTHYEYEEFTPIAAGVLTRVSTPTQVKEGASLGDQERDGRRTAENQIGVPVLKVYEDAGISGDLYDARPALQSALADIRAGFINVLIVHDPSRLTWNPEHRPRIIRDVMQAGGRIFLVSHNTYIDPDDAFQSFALGVQTEADRMYRMHLRSRSMAVRRKLTEDEGRQMSRSKSPFGYHIVTRFEVKAGKAEAGTEGRYTIVEDEAESVRLIFQWFAIEGVSLREVVRRLDAAGRKTKTGKTWRPTSVRIIITNPVYYGEARAFSSAWRKDESRLSRPNKNDRHGGLLKTIYYLVQTPGRALSVSAPALVSKKIWDLAQERLQDNRGAISGNPHYCNLLTGFIRCPLCGERMGSHTTSDPKRQTQHSYHFCRDKCHSRSYLRSAMEILTAQAIQTYLTDGERLTAAVDLWFQAEQNDEESQRGETVAERERVRLRERIAELERRREQLIGSATGDETTMEFLSASLKRLADEWKAARTALTEAEQDTVAPPPERIRPEEWEARRQKAVQAMLGAESLLTDPELPMEKRKAVLRHLVREVRPMPMETWQRIERFGGVTVDFLPLMPAGKSADGVATVPMISIRCTVAGAVQVLATTQADTRIGARGLVEAAP